MHDKLCSHIDTHENSCHSDEGFSKWYTRCGYREINAHIIEIAHSMIEINVPSVSSQYDFLHATCRITLLTLVYDGLPALLAEGTKI